MNEEMRENVKIGLLGLIAVVLVINTFTGGSSSSATDKVNSANRNANVVATTDNSAPANNNIAPEITPAPSQNEPQQPAEPAGPSTTFKFDKELHDFGTIKQNTENKHVFSFTNTGQHPLIIENAKGSCGCTVPQYPKEPIPPGGTGEIEVEYKPGKQKGQQTKSVTITANTEPRVTRINIKANVEEVEG